MEIIEITEKPYSIDSSESYSKEVFLYRDNIIIPYINLAVISDNSILKIPKQSYISYSYLILKNTMEFAWSFRSEGRDRFSRIIFDDHNPCFTEYYSGGGMDRNHSGYEFRIKFKSVFVALPDFATVSRDMWLPVDTPNYLLNMISTEVSNFLKRESVPIDVLDLLKAQNTDLESLCLDDSSYYHS